MASLRHGLHRNGKEIILVYILYDVRIKYSFLGYSSFCLISQKYQSVTIILHKIWRDKQKLSIFHRGIFPISNALEVLSSFCARYLSIPVRNTSSVTSYFTVWCLISMIEEWIRTNPKNKHLLNRKRLQASR